MSIPPNDTAIVIYEDRPNYETGVKLLILSLEANCPQVNIHVFTPNATENFQSWINHRSATLHLKSPSKAKGWNVKPDVLLWALDQGYSQAIWMDSDMV
ncbi:hypothetical protein PCC7424_4331 [Gloeothece citriformis PCC 7424]|uniref:Glycosyltransferase n=1 Tax=Gloeothece citriformis (strain PCC 7424) TaxID=65393 RepID=B7K6Z9_GLOC7|nr:hypothetical protein [Gloeothece citriformis]ACK72698.1 hypothetical protein PCC7424_4331 [Gloeothece citriformis PCC 7424]